MGWFVIVKKSTTLVLGTTIIDKILSSMQEVMKILLGVTATDAILDFALSVCD